MVWWKHQTIFIYICLLPDEIEDGILKGWKHIVIWNKGVVYAPYIPQIMNEEIIRPTVVHFKKSPYDVYIGRGSKWGNPYTHIRDRQTKAEFIVDSREEAIEKYREYILIRPDLMNDLYELNGKILGCWCVNKPITEFRENKQCHGEVLADLVMKYCKQQL